jgi:ferredoxin
MNKINLEVVSKKIVARAKSIAYKFAEDCETQECSKNIESVIKGFDNCPFSGLSLSLAGDKANIKNYCMELDVALAEKPDESNGVVILAGAFGTALGISTCIASGACVTLAPGIIAWLTGATTLSASTTGFAAFAGVTASSLVADAITHSKASGLSCTLDSDYKAFEKGIMNTTCDYDNFHIDADITLLKCDSWCVLYNLAYLKAEEAFHKGVGEIADYFNL